MMQSDAIGLAAKAGLWTSLAAIAFVTLSPIEMRPHVADVQAEHLAAFAVVGFFAALAYPRRVLPTLVFIVAAGACLEAAQHFVPGRHARLEDFAVKAIGGFLGFGVAMLAKSRMRTAARPSAR